MKLVMVLKALPTYEHVIARTVRVPPCILASEVEQDALDQVSCHKIRLTRAKILRRVSENWKGPSLSIRISLTSEKNVANLNHNLVKHHRFRMEAPLNATEVNESRLRRFLHHRTQQHSGAAEQHLELGDAAGLPIRHFPIFNGRT